MVDACGDICEHASKGIGTVRAGHHTWGSAIGTGHFASLRLSEPTKRNVGDKERTGGRMWASEALTFVADAGSYVPASNLACGRAFRVLERNLSGAARRAPGPRSRDGGETPPFGKVIISRKVNKVLSPVPFHVP